MSHPRLLIVGTIPYNTKDSSRAFEAYFHNWEKENIAQIFSDPKTPVKGHCGTLFQITDYRLLQRWKGKKVETVSQLAKRIVWEQSTVRLPICCVVCFGVSHFGVLKS